MQSEQTIQQEIRLYVGEKFKNTRLFRNNVGAAVLKDGRRIDFGLCVGSSDTVGWTTRTITQEMVGQKVAIFTAIEVKTATGKASDVQQRFINYVHNAGGLSAICRNVQDVEKLLASDNDNVL